MRLLLDECVSLPTHTFLRQSGYDCVTVHALGYRRHLADALKTIPTDHLTGSLLIVDRTKYRLRRPA